MKRVLLVVVLSLLSACAGPNTPFSGYEFQGAETHPALPPGTSLATWAAGSGRERVHDRAIRTADGDERPGDLAELAEFALAPQDGPSAKAFIELARLLDVGGVPVAGTPIVPHPTMDGDGARGRYSHSDARSWDIEFDSPGRPNGGGVEVESVVLIAPEQHDMLKHWSPWRVIHVREIVYPDGAVQVLEERTVTNGNDAARFAEY